MSACCKMDLFKFKDKYGKELWVLKYYGNQGISGVIMSLPQLFFLQSQSEPVKIRNMKDLYMHTYKNDHRATIALENRVRHYYREKFYFYGFYPCIDASDQLQTE